MSTIKQIALISGVSRGTVDRVLHNRGKVNPETEQRIREAAALLNYSPSKAGRTLAVLKKNLKFGYILFSKTEVNPFFEEVEAGIHSKEKELTEYGISVDIMYSDFDNWEQQVAILDYFMRQQYNGVALTPVNHAKVAEKIQELSRVGIPVVTANSDIDCSGRIAYVGSNYSQSGRSVAGLFHLICPKGAKIGIISGSKSILCHTERIRGFSERIEEAYPELEIVAEGFNEDDDIKSYIETKKILKEHPQINALFLVAAGIQGACTAAEESGRKLIIVSFDCTPVTRRLIEKGIIAATIDQQPAYQGSKPLDILFELVVNGIAPTQSHYFTNASILIRETI